MYKLDFVLNLMRAKRLGKLGMPDAVNVLSAQIIELQDYLIRNNEKRPKATLAYAKDNFKQIKEEEKGILEEAQAAATQWDLIITEGKGNLSKAKLKEAVDWEEQRDYYYSIVTKIEEAKKLLKTFISAYSPKGAEEQEVSINSSFLKSGSIRMPISRAKTFKDWIENLEFYKDYPQNLKPPYEIDWTSTIQLKIPNSVIKTDELNHYINILWEGIFINDRRLVTILKEINSDDDRPRLYNFTTQVVVSHNYSWSGLDKFYFDIALHKLELAGLKVEYFNLLNTIINKILRSQLQEWKYEITKSPFWQLVINPKLKDLESRVARVDSTYTHREKALAHLLKVEAGEAEPIPRKNQRPKKFELAFDSLNRMTKNISNPYREPKVDEYKNAISLLDQFPKSKELAVKRLEEINKSNK